MLSLLQRVKEKAIQKAAQVASSPVLNNMASAVPTAQGIGQRFQQAQPQQFNLLNVPGQLKTGQIRSGIPQLDAVGQKIGAYVDNQYVQSGRDVPMYAQQAYAPNKTPLQRAGSVGMTALSTLGAVPDPTDALFSAWNMAKGFQESNRQGGDLKQNLSSGVNAVTLENPVGLGDTVTDNPTGQMVGNLAEIPLLLLAGGLKAKNVDEAASGLNKIKVPTMDEFFERSNQTIKNTELPKTIKGQELDHIDAVDELIKTNYDGSYDSAKLLTQAHEWFSRGSESFDSKKFTPTMARYISELGNKTVSDVLNKHANATKVSDTWKTDAWKELNEIATTKNPSWKKLEDERMQSLVDQGDELAEGIPTKSTQGLIDKKKPLISEKFTPDTAATEKSSVVQGYVQTRIDEITKSLELKGSSWNEAVDQIEIGNINKNIKEETKAVSEILDTLNKAGEKKFGRIANIRENYFPHRSIEQIDEVINQGFGQSLVDASYMRERTGTMTDYAKDGSVLRRYAAETLGPDDPIKVKEMKLAQEIVNEVKKVTTDTPKGTTDFKNPNLDYVSKIERDFPPEEGAERVKYLILGKDDAGTSLFRGVDERAAMAGEKFYTDFLDPFKKAQVNNTTYFDQISKLDDAGVLSVYSKSFGVLRKELTRTEMIARLSFSNNKKTMSEAQDIFLQNVKKADLNDTKLRKLINDVANEYISKDIHQGILGSKVLGAIRSMTGRGALWFNVASGINNVFELKRALSTVSVKSSKAAYKRLLAGDNVVAKYGIDSKMSTALNRRTKFKLLEQVDSAGFYLFDKTESLKDNIMLLSFEEQGLAKGLKDDSLRKYVQQKFSQYAVKYGKGQDIGLFQNDIVKTLGQFGQYAIKDLVIAIDKIKGAAPKSLGGLSDLGDQKYLAKYAVTTAAQWAVMYSVFNKIGFGGQTSTPFDFIKSIAEGKAGKSPIVSLALGLIAEATADRENESDFDKETRRRELKRSAATMAIPGSNQLGFKTGSYINKMKTGNYDTISGNVANETSNNLFDNAKGLLFGPSYDSKRQDYIDTGVKTGEFPSLDKNESAAYRALQNEEDKTKYYEANKGTVTSKKQVLDKLEKGDTRSLWDKLTGKEEKKAELDWSTKPTTKTEESEYRNIFNASVEAGVDLPPEAYSNVLFGGKKITNNTSITDKESLYSDAKKVMEDEFYTDEQKSKALNAVGIDPKDYEYYKMASMDDLDKRDALVVEFVSGKFESRAEMLMKLAGNKKTVAGKAMSRNTDFDYLYDQGYIEKEEKAFLSAIKYNEKTGEFYVDRDYKPKGSGMSNSEMSSLVNKVNSLFSAKPTKKKSTFSEDAIPSITKAPKLTFNKKKSSSGGRTETRWFDSY